MHTVSKHNFVKCYYLYLTLCRLLKSYTAICVKYHFPKKIYKETKKDDELYIYSVLTVNCRNGPIPVRRGTL
jgi:hypothetical protein